jgi:sulfite reductase alpha subunit-like flavoprotein
MIFVVYGSQSGNSEEIAKRISKEVQSKFKEVQVEYQVMNKFLSTLQKFPEKKEMKFIVIAVCSTTGAGDPPTNSENFVRWIKRKTHASDTLSNVSYTVLGLGDSNYTKYQLVPRLVDESLQKIGAKKFYARGEADDAYGLEMVVEPWIEKLYPALDQLLQKNLSQSDKISTTSNLDYIFHETPSQIQENSGNLASSLFTPDYIYNRNFLNASVSSKFIISGPKSEREIVSLKFTIDESQRDLNFNSYLPGTFISILPAENEERIKKISSVLNIDEKQVIVDKSHNFSFYSDLYEKYPHFKKILKKSFITEEDLMQYILDFDSILKKSQVDSLKSFLRNKIGSMPEILEKYEVLFNKYTELILKNRISLFDILASISNYHIQINTSITELLEAFPIKYPRSYSLLSYDYKSEDNPLEIVFSVVNDRVIRKFPNLKLNSLPLGIKPGEYYYRGQTSNFLKNLKKGEELFICDIGNCFEFPGNAFLNEKKPIVYICNGTGISPCISFLKFLLLNVDMINPETVGHLIILTGFRSASDETNETVYEDFINEAIEILRLKTGKNIVDYLRCLSLCSENEEEAVGIWRNCRINTKYVQDLIVENDEKIHKALFIDDGYLMICGDVEKLYDECINNIQIILSCRNGLNSEISNKYIQKMKDSGKLIIEKWM